MNKSRDSETLTNRCLESQLLEYEQANEWWRELSQMRRHDMAFFTAAQGAVLTIIGHELLSMTARGVTLSVIAFLIAVIGLNNERRLYSYLKGFRERALSIELDCQMSLIKSGTEKVKQTRLVIPSSIAFAGYYAFIALGWVVVWLLNLK